MTQILFPCCDVGGYLDSESLKADCWMCGLPDFTYVMDMEERDHPYNFYYRFIYVLGRVIRPTGAKPPWSI